MKGSSHDPTHSSSPGRLSLNGRAGPRVPRGCRKPMLNHPFSPRRKRRFRETSALHGMTNKEIAQMIGGITEQSVKNFVAHVVMKTGAPNRVRMVVWALKNDLINVENL